MLQALNVTWTVPDRSYTAGGRLFVDRQNKIKIRDAEFERGKI